MLCSDVISQVSLALNDPNDTLFSAQQKITSLNDALRALVSVRPDASSVTATRLLSAGTKQSLPSDGVRLIRAVRNKGEDGLSTGRAIRMTDISTMDAIFPEWHTQASQITVRECMMDPRSPTEFWVYPPAPTSPVIGIEISYVKKLTEITAGTDTFPVDDYYAPAVQEWMLYRLWASDDEASPNYQASQAHLRAFMDLLGVKSSGDAAVAGVAAK